MSNPQPFPDPGSDYNPFGHYHAHSNSHVYFETVKTSSSPVLTEETITLVRNDLDSPPHAWLSYSEFIDADNIIITFDGVKYPCERIVGPKNDSWYGKYDDGTIQVNQDYPFALLSFSGNDISVYGGFAGDTHTVKIEIPGEAQEEFSKNIKVNSSMEYTNVVEDEVSVTLDDQISYNITTMDDGLHGKPSPFGTQEPPVIQN